MARKTQSDAILHARLFCEQRFPHALLVVLCGSWATKDARDDSDLDIVVLDDGIPDVLCEATFFESWLIEVCAMAPSRVEAWFHGSRQHRTAPIPHQIINGILVTGEMDRLIWIQDLAREILVAGPKPLTDAEVLDVRWNLSALLRDLEHVPLEGLPSLAAQCYAGFAQVALDLAGAWRGDRKTLRLSLLEAAPGIAERLDAGLLAACQNDRGPMLDIGRDILTRLGGPLFTYMERY